MKTDEKSQAVVGEVKKHHGLFRYLPNIKFGKRAKIATIFISLLILATGIFLSTNYDKEYLLSRAGIGDKVIFKIGNKAYRKSTVENLIEPALLQGQDRTALIKQAHELLLIKQAATDAGINFTSNEIDPVRSNLRFPDKSGQANNEWADLVAFNLLLAQSKLFGDNGFKGYSFVFWFGHKIQKGFDQPPAGFGDPNLIAEDRKYALEKAEEYHQILKDNKNTADDIVKKIKEDPRLGYGQANSGFSGQFGNSTVINWEEQVYYQQIIEYVKSQTTSGLSELKTGKIAKVEDPQSDNDYAETFYYFVKLDEANIKSIDERLKDKLQSVKTKYYGL